MDLAEPTACERSRLAVLDDLQDSPAIEVLNEAREEIGLMAEDSVFDDLAEWDGIEPAAGRRGTCGRCRPSSRAFPRSRPHATGGPAPLKD